MILNTLYVVPVWQACRPFSDLFIFISGQPIFSIHPSKGRGKVNLFKVLLFFFFNKDETFVKSFLLILEGCCGFFFFLKQNLRKLFL